MGMGKGIRPKKKNENEGWRSINGGSVMVKRAARREGLNWRNVHPVAREKPDAKKKR